MSKGLEALEKLNHTICLNLNNKTLQFNLDKYEDCDCKDIREFCDCYEVIEKELKELYGRREMMARLNEACEPHIIEDEVYKKARAFDIIKEKRVNIDYLRSCKSLEDYNNILIEKWQLTQEEYDLLKEVLDNGR